MKTQEKGLSRSTCLFVCLLLALLSFVSESTVWSCGQRPILQREKTPVPLANDLLFQAQHKWQVTGRDLPQQSFDSAELKRLLQRLLKDQGAKVISSWKGSWNRNQFNAFIRQIREKLVLPKTTLVLAVTCQPKQPCFFTYTLLGKKRYLFLPPAVKPYQVYFPLPPENREHLANIRLYTLTPRCIYKKAVYALTILQSSDNVLERIKAACLFEDRIFFPYSIRFNFPLILLPIGDQVNSSFYMSNVKTDSRKNEVSPTLFLPQGTCLKTNVQIPNQGSLSFEYALTPFLSLDKTCFTLRIVVDQKSVTTFSREIGPDTSEKGFKTGQIDLSPYRGKTATIYINNSCPNNFQKNYSLDSSTAVPANFILLRNLVLKGETILQETTIHKPNIVIIVPDSLRADTAYDQSLLTPGCGLSSLLQKKDTLVFTRAYSPSNTTTPSTNCLLHGNYLAEFPYYFFPAQQKNLLAYLCQAGYHTYCLTTNPYLIPKLEFFTDKYIFYNQLMDGDLLFLEAINLIQTTDQEQRPIALFIQTMETHSPDNLPMIKQDLLAKPALARKLLAFLGTKSKPETEESLLQTTIIEPLSLELGPYPSLSDSLNWDKNQTVIKFTNAKRLALQFDPRPLGLVHLGDQIEEIYFMLECSSKELAKNLTAGTVQLFLPDKKNQLYQIGPPKKEAQSPCRVQITLNLTSCLAGGPNKKRLPLSNYIGQGIIQLRFSRPSSGQIKIKAVKVAFDTPLLKEAIDSLSQKAGRRLSLLQHGVLQGQNYLDPDELNKHRLAYRAKMIYFDFKLDRFLQSIWYKLNIDPVIFYFADHGQSLGEHDHYGHGSALFDQQINVPLVAHLPRQLGGKNIWIDDPTSTLNLYQTIAKLLQIPPPPGTRGTNLLSLVTKEAASTDLFSNQFVISQIDPRATVQEVAIINKDVKIIVDLQTNQWSTLAIRQKEAPTILSPETRKKVKTLIAAYKALQTKGAEKRQSKRLDQLIDLNKKRLKDLGYIE